MQSLKERLEAISRGEITEMGGAQALPIFAEEEMKKCVTALQALIAKTKGSSRGVGRVQPPSCAVHVIL